MTRLFKCSDDLPRYWGLLLVNRSNVGTEKKKKSAVCISTGFQMAVC